MIVVLLVLDGREADGREEERRRGRQSGHVGAEREQRLRAVDVAVDARLGEHRVARRLRAVRRVGLVRQQQLEHRRRLARAAAEMHRRAEDALAAHRAELREGERLVATAATARSAALGVASVTTTTAALSATIGLARVATAARKAKRILAL